jgi:hypothetical protein
MSQTRVVISDRLRPIAEELQSITGVSSLSDVVALLLTKYSQHLKTSWIENGMQILSPKTNTTVLQPVQLPKPVESQIQEPQYVQEPELEPIDPIIAHIAQHVDTF